MRSVTQMMECTTGMKASTRPTCRGAKGMTKANTTEKEITTPHANLRCWSLAGTLATSEGTSFPSCSANSLAASLFIRTKHRTTCLVTTHRTKPQRTGLLGTNQCFLGEARLQKSCSRSQGQPVPEVRSAAMISSKCNDVLALTTGFRRLCWWCGLLALGTIARRSFTPGAAREGCPVRSHR